MTIRDDLWEVAIDQYGYVTSLDAHSLGIPGAQPKQPRPGLDQPTLASGLGGAPDSVDGSAQPTHERIDGGGPDRLT